MPPNEEPFDENGQPRKRAVAKDPLADYFGGKPAAPPPAPPPPADPNVRGAPPATNVGSGATPANNTGSQTEQPQPTGFTNFNRVIAANKSVSDREANDYGRRAQRNVDAASQSLDALRARFGAGVRDGTVGAAQAGFAAQPTSGDGLLGESTRPVMGGGLSSDQMYANGALNYSGPGGLGDATGAADTYGKTLGAEQNLAALGTEGGLQALIQKQNTDGSEGTSSLSSALIGNAGRGDFDALRARFHPENDIKTAETDAETQAKAAGALSKKNANDWNALADKAKDGEDAAAGVAGASTVSARRDEAKQAYDALPAMRGEYLNWSTMAQSWKDDTIKRAVDGWKGQTSSGITGQSSKSTGLTVERVKHIFESMTDDEFSRWTLLGNIQAKNDYLTTKDKTEINGKSALAYGDKKVS